MAEERQNPAQMMLQRNRAAAELAVNKKKEADERRASSREQAQADVKDFTPEDESFEMEGATAPKEKAAPKYFKGEGGFEYLHDPETGAFTITNAPKNYAHLKGKNVTSGKAYDSIMAEMETGQSLYQAEAQDEAPADPVTMTPTLAPQYATSAAPDAPMTPTLAPQYATRGFVPETSPQPAADPVTMMPPTPPQYAASAAPAADPRDAAMRDAFGPALEEAEAGERRRAEQAAVERGGRLTGSMDNPFG